METNKGKEKALQQNRINRFKKIILLVFFIMLVILLVSMFTIKAESRQIVLSKKENNIENIDESNAIVSSATIIDTKTGTGPFDDNDEPGNDSSESNNIIRSFDQITWTLDLTINSKNDEAIGGSKIQIEITLPEETANVVKWDLEKMKWIENGAVSDDGRTLTGSYTVSDTETSSSAKQTLIFTLQVYGAKNGTKIIPNFTFMIEKNQENEKKTTVGEEIKVSSKGKYNIQLQSNTGSLSNKTTVNYGSGDVSGRMYGYGFTVQLYNDSVEKELKGLEYPEGEITFDIDLKLERSKADSEDYEDITNQCTPILWNYSLNNWSETKGLIEGRNMYYINGYHRYSSGLPLGIYDGDNTYSTYDSGDIKITQEGSRLKVSINNYSFNGIFPYYGSSYRGAPNRTKVYSNNIGTFSVGYMQIFVPDNDESTLEDRKYYLTINDNNMNITSMSDEKMADQIKTSDDNIKIQHLIRKAGSYGQTIEIYKGNSRERGIVETSYGTGDGRVELNGNFTFWSKFSVGVTNDEDVQSADKFIKFDGEGIEPRYLENGNTYFISSLNGSPTFKIWYVTKKDGTNWNSQSEMNNANIEDMDIYERIEDIPENKICIGVFAETTGGYISRTTGDNNLIVIPLKVKDTAQIGKTYGMTQRTRVWIDKLDRNIYSVAHPENKMPTPTWDSGNKNYVKTEYDENGNMVAGTHSGGASYGNTILVVGAKLHADLKVINKDELKYDLGKNEDTVNYIIQPQIDENPNITSQITNITVKVQIILPSGLRYVPGSGKRGENQYIEPEIEENNGVTTLTWYLYNCTSGTEITPITFDVAIDNETLNGTKYETKLVVSEVIGDDEQPKIGNTKLEFRTSTVSIDVINLASHRLYKETDTPVIEKNGDIQYKIIYENKTEQEVPDFQLLDILPYNGDIRGSNFNGTLMLKNINITQTIDGKEQNNDNLNLYITNSDDVKTIDAKNPEIGVSSIWENITETATNKNLKAIAVKGDLAGKTKIEINITLSTNGNKAKDIYINNVMAQIYSNSEQMETSKVSSQVVNRYIEGKIWQDDNSNGVIDQNEKYLNNVNLELINTADNNVVKTASSDENGIYRFNELNKGKYKIRIKVNDTYYELTKKEVGTNAEINSKFNQGINETDEITRLDSIQSPELAEININAGLAIKKINIEVTKIWEDNNNKGEKRPEKITMKLSGDGKEYKKELDVTDENNENSNIWNSAFENIPKYDKNLDEIEYVLSEEDTGNIFYVPQNTIIEQDTRTITNTFEVPDERISVTVTKQWNDNGNIYGRRPESIYLKLTGNGEEYKQEVYGNGNEWTYTFTNLPKYDSLGDEIIYTASEEEVNTDGFKFYSEPIITGNMANGYIIENTFRVPDDKISLKINKEWQDNSVQAQRRPNIITINVLNENREIVGSYDLKVSEGEQSYTFTNLPKYNSVNGVEINYTVEEENTQDLYFYNSSVGETITKNEREKEITITNIFRRPEETISIDVNKIWDDQENIYNKRPTSLKINVKDNTGTVKGSTIVTKDNMWNGRIENLQKYDENGQEIVYTVFEEEINKDDLFYYTGNTAIATDKVSETNGKEATITNKMTKIPAKVIVKYIDKNSGTEISPANIKEGIVGDEFNITEDKKEIPGYTLIEEPVEKEGIYTINEQEKIYYYSKNTKVIVKYLEKDETPENTEDNYQVASEEIIDGYVGKDYKAEEKEVENYTLIENTQNIEGKMTEEIIEVVYYYAKNTSVVVKYLEKDTNTVLADEIIIYGFEGKDYETEKKEIYNYTFVEDTGNTSGKMTEEKIEVIYYYAQNTKAKVQHIDRETKEILKEETKFGKVGDLFVTHSESFEGFVLVEEPSEPNIIMDKTGEQIVRYYYAHISPGVIENHIDIISGEILETSKHNGNEGDLYNILSKEFSGYDLVEKDEEGNNILPVNSNGKMKRDETINVTYYYIKKARVIIRYVDENTSEEILESDIIEGHENDFYETKEKDIENYNLTKIPDNSSGKMVITKNEDGTYNTDIEVIYYYKKIAGGVVENHIDIFTNEILDTIRYEGNVNDDYKILPKEFPKYDLVEDKLPENSQGKMTEEEIVVNYYYTKRAKVIVQYIDILTDEKIKEDNVINGHIGDDYSIINEHIASYDLVEEERPENEKGKMLEEETTVKYYYIRKAKVEVKYVEKETDEEILESEILRGYVGDRYETEQKDIEYYKFVEKTDNWKGEMTREGVTVIYYYEKEIFDFMVDEWIESVSVDGVNSSAQDINSSNQIYKIDIHRNKADTADILVTYKIRLTNKGEIEGTVDVLTDIIPEGYTFLQENNQIHWDNNDGILTTDELKDEIIKPGEFKEISLILKVSKGSENFGQKDNMVLIRKLSNPASYQDIDKNDNSDVSSMILSVATGDNKEQVFVPIIILLILLIIYLCILLIYKKKSKL